MQCSLAFFDKMTIRIQKQEISSERSRDVTLQAAKVRMLLTIVGSPTVTRPPRQLYYGSLVPRDHHSYKVYLYSKDACWAVHLTLRCYIRPLKNMIRTKVITTNILPLVLM